MNIVYGPIASWRLGRSLGVDLICKSKKICSLDCNYCQIQKTEKITCEMASFISLNQLKNELKSSLDNTKLDVITFSGMGEPTLASNMPEAIDTIRDLSDKPIAILTNSTLLNNKIVQQTLIKIDIIVAKLDAVNNGLFKKISRPAENVTFKETIEGIKQMRKLFPKKFALQIMFMDENKDYIEKFVDLSHEIKPDEIQINTPLRPCNITPLSKDELELIERQFKEFNTISVFKSKRPITSPIDKSDLKRRIRQLK